MHQSWENDDKSVPVPGPVKDYKNFGKNILSLKTKVKHLFLPKL